jgi:hypothetical protein
MLVLILNSSYINNIKCSEEASPKLFWNYIKNKKNDRCGVAPLKRNGLTFSDSTTKANILNSQFSSVLTSEDLSNISDMGVSSTPEIPPIYMCDYSCFPVRWDFTLVNGCLEYKRECWCYFFGCFLQ